MLKIFNEVNELILWGKTYKTQIIVPSRVFLHYEHLFKAVSCEYLRCMQLKKSLLEKMFVINLNSTPLIRFIWVLIGLGQ